jgi:hypothetical protein
MLRRVFRLSPLLLCCLLPAACRRMQADRLEAVRALRSQVRPRFRPPADGRLTPAQIDGYLRVRRAGGAGSEADAARAAGMEPAEFAWVRARIVEALNALQARQVSAAAAEAYARGIASLREARAAARDAPAAARLDAELAGLERERATIRRSEESTPAIVFNASLIAPRRNEIASAAP